MIRKSPHSEDSGRHPMGLLADGESKSPHNSKNYVYLIFPQRTPISNP